MRTAKKIFAGYRRQLNNEISNYWCTEKDFIHALNQSRIELLKECADLYVPDGNPQVFRDKILNLINQIK